MPSALVFRGPPQLFARADADGSISFALVPGEGDSFCLQDVDWQNYPFFPIDPGGGCRQTVRVNTPGRRLSDGHYRMVCSFYPEAAANEKTAQVWDYRVV